MLMAAALASLVFSVNLTLLTCSSARTQPLYPETLSSNPVGLKTASPLFRIFGETPGL